jgi:hypothetical protein
VARHELAKCPLQLLFVDFVGTRDQFQQGVAERCRVGASEREQQVLQCGLLLCVEAADGAEVEQGEAAVGEQQDVARMRVGVNTPPSVIWYTMLRSNARVSSARSSPRSSISGPAARRLTPSSHSMTSTCSVHSGSYTAGSTTATWPPTACC